MIAIDLYCGLGGWAEGLMAEGFRVIGFDNECHEYGEHRYPGQLVIQDVLTLHGRQFKDADLIVASPPCTEYSYMAMPWVRSKRIAMALRGEGDSTPYTYPDGRVLKFDGDGFPLGYTGSRTITELNRLFDACFRIQREASEAAGRHIPMVVENVVGAQKWVGKARWHYGSYYLWGDIPALMPMLKGRKNTGGSWFNVAHNTTSGKGRNPDGRKVPHYNTQGRGGYEGVTPRLTNPAEHLKCPGNEFGEKGFNVGVKRKFASAMIAKIPFELSRHIARVYRP